MSTDEAKCAVCGTDERPDKGWIYKSTDVRPVEIKGGELRFEAEVDATAYCSTDCSQQAESGRAECYRSDCDEQATRLHYSTMDLKHDPAPCCDDCDPMAQTREFVPIDQKQQRLGRDEPPDHKDVRTDGGHSGGDSERFVSSNCECPDCGRIVSGVGVEDFRPHPEDDADVCVWAAKFVPRFGADDGQYIIAYHRDETPALSDTGSDPDA